MPRHLLAVPCKEEGPLSYNVPAGREKSFTEAIYAFEAAAGENVEAGSG